MEDNSTSQQSPTISYASLAASHRPTNSLNKTRMTPSSSKPRKELSIIDPEKIVPAVPIVPGTQKHSVFYEIPTSLKDHTSTFLTALHSKYEDSICGINTKDNTQGQLIEVFLTDDSTCDTICTAGIISVNDITVKPIRALPPSHTVMKVSLSKLPLLPLKELSISLKKL